MGIYNLWNNKQILKSWMKTSRYYALSLNVYEMDMHCHNEIEIMYVLYGECTVEYMDEKGNLSFTRLHKEEYIFLDANVSHRLILERGGKCRLFNIEVMIEPAYDKFCIGEICEYSTSVKKMLFKNKTFFIQKDKDGELFKVIKGIQYYEESDMDKVEKKCMVNLLFHQFIIILARQETTKAKSINGNKYIKEAKKYMESHLEEEFKIKDIASQIGISEAYLQRIFKEKEEISLIEYCNLQRIRRAKVLLEYSNLAIIDVAIGVGFKSRQHFSNIFHKIEGISPGIYRKNNSRNKKE